MFTKSLHLYPFWAIWMQFIILSKFCLLVKSFFKFFEILFEVPFSPPAPAPVRRLSHKKFAARIFCEKVFDKGLLLCYDR